MPVMYGGLPDGRLLSYGWFGGMHSRFDIAIISCSTYKPRVEPVIDRCHGIVRELEMLGNRFDPESAVSRHSRGVIPMPEKLSEILERCTLIAAPTDGYFNMLHDGNIPDLGGFLKGYAAERVKELVERDGITDMLVNAGNSSIVARGGSPSDAGGWNITLSGGKSLLLKNCAMSISGRQQWGDGRHIADPHTGTLVDGDDVCVTGPQADVCEVLSTALYAAPEPERGHIIRAFPGYHRESIQ